jgi:hypothetical protein
MKKTVLTFGLISGLIISVLMCGSLLLADKIASGHSMALGYTIMVASFLLIYFGIRSYRDNTLAGQISFGRAFACGILITSSLPSATSPCGRSSTSTSCPTSWIGTSPRRFTRSSPPDLTPPPPPRRSLPYNALSSSTKNPFVNMAYTFMEPLPVGLIITLISAAILRRKAPVEPTAAPAVMTT